MGQPGADDEAAAGAEHARGLAERTSRMSGMCSELSMAMATSKTRILQRIAEPIPKHVGDARAVHRVAAWRNCAGETVMPVTSAPYSEASMRAVAP